MAIAEAENVIAKNCCSLGSALDVLDTCLSIVRVILSCMSKYGEKPVIQGPMAWSAFAPLVAAVSNAGGLGVLGVASAPPHLVREQIQIKRIDQSVMNVCI